ncbi:hypothetical protein CXF67_04610 [Psychroflexus sp. MES1-P1E]|nr:hypothetical protein CXF67_04610 [Psychroflexus sp. MES1-P1E]
MGKELNVKTPFQAVYKLYEIELELFKTTLKFEILIHDDASTDGNIKIIKNISMAMVTILFYDD